ncbi:putative RNA-directed DNA polymerase [Aphis craccivora]|uniref:Putative RNA-directed DNA polymerase n=1 Tax=Aphis craccivora TaxID=307492 RepID=A0A6G0YJ62_APHCR|nr:putative RNA-directed DNA polymerase [Aphis craccivora]
MNITLIQTIMTYDPETWPLRKAKETRLKVFERRILRKIYGLCVDTHTREWRTNIIMNLKICSKFRISQIKFKKVVEVGKIRLAKNRVKVRIKI